MWQTQDPAGPESQGWGQGTGGLTVPVGPVSSLPSLICTESLPVACIEVGRGLVVSSVRPPSLDEACSRFLGPSGYVRGHSPRQEHCMRQGRPWLPGCRLAPWQEQLCKSPVGQVEVYCCCSVVTVQFILRGDRKPGVGVGSDVCLQLEMGQISKESWDYTWLPRMSIS